MLILTFTFLLAEVAGALWTGSLALLADAGHMVTDVGGLALALLAMWFAKRPATARRTYGYHRVEILAALANGIVLVAISGGILYEAYERFWNPPTVATGTMLLIGGLGLIVNLVGVFLLRSDVGDNVNMKGAYFELLSDLLSSVGVIVAGALMMTMGASAGSGLHEREGLRGRGPGHRRLPNHRPCETWRSAGAGVRGDAVRAARWALGPVGDRSERARSVKVGGNGRNRLRYSLWRSIAPASRLARNDDCGHTRSMRRWSQRVRALVAALAVLAPWVQTATVATHQMAGHHEPHADHSLTLEQLFHGHSHGGGTPPHSHAFVAPKPPAKPPAAPVLTALHPAWAALFVTGARFDLEGSRMREQDRGSGTSPPPFPAQFTILRV